MSEWPANCVLGELQFPSRAVYAEFSNTPTDEKDGWLADPRNADRWQRANGATQETASAKQAPCTPDYNAMQPYVDCGYDLIPLGANRKFPTGEGWTRRSYSKAEISNARDAGFNFGIRPTRDQLIIDVDVKDPTKDGAASIAKLCADTGIDPKTCPRVNTPSGGYHLYARNPTRVDIPKISKSYPGIDFLSCESYQGVAAGSVVNGKRYTWDFTHPTLDKAPPISAKMIDALTIKITKSVENVSSAAAIATEDQLSAILGALPVTKYKTGDAHRDMIHAIKDGTRAASWARLMTIDWSATDPEFANDQVKTADVWDRSDLDRAEGVKVGTLFNELKLAGRADLIPKADGRPRVTLELFDLNGSIDRTEAALVEAGAPIYQRGGEIVHVFRLDDDKTEGLIERKRGSLGIHEVSATRLTQYLDKHVAFYRLNKDGEPKRQSAPAFGYISSQIVARIDLCKFRVLDGIIETPMLRADGSPLSAPGYDPASRLLLDGGDLVVLPIAATLTHDDAMRSMKVITDVVDEFPFVPDDENVPLGTLGIPCASRSVAVAGILTGLQRRVLNNAPAIAADANGVGTGKSALCDVIAIAVTGREAPKMTLPTNEEESLKAWLTTLMTGDQIMCIDNVPKGVPVTGGVLAKVITETRLKGRILGTNTNADVPTNALVLINGNNLTFGGDLASRGIKSRMDCGHDHADKRTFKRDILAYTKEHRGEIVAAALTIMRAYIVAGKPKPESFVPSRFKQWDDLIRGAIIWCGEPDPMLTVVEIDAADPERTDLAGLHEAFVRCFGDRWVGSKEIMACIEQGGDAGRALQAALTSGSGDGHLAKKNIAYIIKTNKDMIVGGRRFRCRTNSSQVVHFRVENIEAAIKEPAVLL